MAESNKAKARNARGSRLASFSVLLVLFRTLFRSKTVLQIADMRAMFYKCF